VLEGDNDNTQQLLDLADAVIANDFGKTAEEMHDEIYALKKENAALQAENQRREPAAETSRGEPKKYTVPPELYQELDAELHFDKDPCPVDRPEGYNSLDEDWGKMNFVNPWFSAKRSPDGHGPTDFARKAIEESKKGRSSFITLPVPNYVDLLLAAGAEPRSLGKVKWIEAETGEPHPHPPFIAGFLLRGKPDKE
jgi:hypothetical protein